jgi:hypothetical protein
MVHTEQLVETLLNHVATYPNYGIVYRASDMVLCTHADAGYLNESRSRSRAGAHIYFLEDNSTPQFNGAVLTITTVVKFVMALAAKAELAALYIAAGKIPANPHRHGLAATMQPYPNEHLNSSGITNKTIVPKLTTTATCSH